MKINFMKAESTISKTSEQNQIIIHPTSDTVSKQQALDNLGGNTALYDKYLSRFKINYINSTYEISGMLKAGKVNDARVLIHSIKGLAGTLGLTKLFFTADKLESALCTQPEESQYTALLQLYDKHLHEI